MMLASTVMNGDSDRGLIDPDVPRREPKESGSGGPRREPKG